jgi:CBS domain-containing protein
MRISDVMTSDLPTMGPTDSLCDAALRMRERRVQALPVCEERRLVGIVTDWDVTRAVADGPDVGSSSVADYMTTDVVTAPPDTRLTDASEVMADRRIHHLIVEEEGNFAGMVHLDVEWSEVGGLEAPMATFAARI